MQITVSIGRAAMLLGVSVVTMRRWDKNDVITPAYRTAGNHRRYRLSDIRRLRGETVAQLSLIVSGQMSKLILTHKDRLLRFGHELVFHLCALFSVDVEIIEASKEEAFEVELTKDVITLMTVFSARLYGKRSHQNKARVKTKAIKS